MAVVFAEDVVAQEERREMTTKAKPEVRKNLVESMLRPVG
jgi:hypothetical protein